MDMHNEDQDWPRDSLQQLRSRDGWRRFRGLLSRKKVSIILIALGIVLLGYVGSEYAAMYSEQQALQQQWQQQQSSSAAGLATEPVSKHDGLTRVVIPRIDLDVIVVEGTNRKALRLGPGHLKGTPAPGEAGNSVISAHRDTFFRHIYELKDGDDIQVRRDGHTYTFRVTGKRIVMPDDLSVLKKTADARLTLITCYPIYYIGPAPKRLVVFSKLVGNAKTVQERAQIMPRSGRHS
jgi:sortase A